MTGWLISKTKAVCQVDDLPPRERASDFDRPVQTGSCVYFHLYIIMAAIFLKPSKGPRTKYYKLYISSSCYNKWFIFTLLALVISMEIPFPPLQNEGEHLSFGTIVFTIGIVYLKGMSLDGEMCQ